MTTRQIEECFGVDFSEEEKYSIEHIWIVDPYLVNVKGLMDTRPGKKIIPYHVPLLIPYRIRKRGSRCPMMQQLN